MNPSALNFLNQDNTIFYISDLSKGQFLFISEATSRLLGYLPLHFYKQGVDFFYSLLHQDDFPPILQHHISLKLLAAELAPNEEKVKVYKRYFQLRNSKNEWTPMESIEIVNIVNRGALKIKITGVLRQHNQTNLPNTLEAIDKLSDILFAKRPPFGIERIAKIKESIETEQVYENHASLVKLNIDPNSKIHVSKREQEVLQQIANGYSAKEIGHLLFISESTVITHRKNLLQKFNSKNTAELIKKASKVFWLK